MSKFSIDSNLVWLAEKLGQVDEVTSVEQVSRHSLRISREAYSPFVAGVVSAQRVEAETIRPLVIYNNGIEIIGNVPKESFWTGSAIRLASESDIAIGSLGDIFRAIHHKNVRTFRSKNSEFVERGLTQHDQVSNFELVHDKLYRIARNRFPDLTVAMLHEYELTADRLRIAREWYGPFAIAVNTDPNGSFTNSAEELAESLDIEVLLWRQFLGRLNRA